MPFAKISFIFFRVRQCLSCFLILILGGNPVETRSVFAQSIPQQVVGGKNNTIQSNYPNPHVQITVKELSHFETALANVAAQAHVAFICENQPFQPDLEEGETRNFPQNTLESGMLLEDAVKRIATAYDYEATRFNDKVFLFKKNYSFDEDLPSVTLEEASRSLQLLLRATQNFEAKDSTYCLRDLMISLSASQRTAATKEIRFADFSPQQQELARRVSYSFQYAGRSDIDDLAFRFRAFRGYGIVFTMMTYLNVTVPCYSGRFLSKALLTDRPFINQIKADLGISYWLIPSTSPMPLDEIPRKYSSSGSRVTIEGVEPTTPEAAPISGLPKRVVETRSLKSVMETLNANEQGDVVYETDSSIASKPVYIVGAQNVPAEELAVSAAEVYGLILTRRADKAKIVATITLPQAHLVKDPQLLKTEVERLLPQPVWRAYKAGQNRKRQSDLRVQPGLRPFKLMNGSDGLYITSVKRLRELIEPEIQARKDHRFPIRESSDEVKSLIALSQLLILFNRPHFWELLETPPAFLTNIRENTYRFQLNENGTELTYWFGCHPSPTTTSVIAGKDGVYPPIPRPPDDFFNEGSNQFPPDSP